VTAVPEKAIKVLLVVYNKHLSSQCNVLPQIEHVQDKYQYIDSLIYKTTKKKIKTREKYNILEGSSWP